MCAAKTWLWMAAVSMTSPQKHRDRPFGIWVGILQLVQDCERAQPLHANRTLGRSSHPRRRKAV
jgi:hypothetical protein